jgi:cytochrome c553
MADRGIVEKGVPACNSCHGPDGSGVAPLYPRLAGQSAAYIRTQLEKLGHADRANDPAGMMRGIATRLTPHEARAVAAYYQSLGKQSAAPAHAHP